MFLIIDGEIFSFRQKIADELMVSFCGTFLLGSVWITVKDLCPLLPFFSGLDGCRIGKFTAVVAQKQWEDLFEVIRSKLLIEIIEDISDGSGVIVFPVKSEHELKSVAEGIQKKRSGRG